MVDRTIPSDGEQPCRKGRSLGIKRCQVLVRCQKHILRNVFGFVSVTNKAAHKPIDRILVSLHQHSKLVHVSCDHSPDNVRIDVRQELLLCLRCLGCYTAKLQFGSHVFASANSQGNRTNISLFSREHALFDKLRVSRNLREAVDGILRCEHEALSTAGDERLKGTRYGWLRNPDKETAARKGRWSTSARASFGRPRGGRSMKGFRTLGYTRTAS